MYVQTWSREKKLSSANDNSRHVDRNPTRKRSKNGCSDECYVIFVPGDICGSREVFEKYSVFFFS